MIIKPVDRKILELTFYDKSIHNENILNDAKKRVEESKDYNGSHLEQKGKLYGFFMEIVCAKIFNCEIIGDTDFDADLVNKKGVRFDVKSRHTEYGINIEQGVFNVYVKHGNKTVVEQNVDYFIFCSYTKELSKCWINGYIHKKKLLDLAVIKKKGDKYFKDKNLLYFEDSYCLKFDDIEPAFNLIGK